MHGGAHPAVGVWVVHAPDAPFSRHVLTFHADGTMLQSNPEAGNAMTSDSTGMGIWHDEAMVVRGCFAEVMADRRTRAFVGTGIIDFVVEVDGDYFLGTATTTVLDAHD